MYHVETTQTQSVDISDVWQHVVQVYSCSVNKFLTLRELVNPRSIWKAQKKKTLHRTAPSAIWRTGIHSQLVEDK